ncbi:MAG: GNAT family N-acetyltransferase [Bacteroidales bacterium]|nr:GNAT family N-acetyltransferase [Bacteroidales bacterium]
MKDIIAPVPVEAIMEELTQEKFFRKTNNGGNEIYVLTAHESPNIMREIGRLREISFRDSGGGTGLDCDIDVFDTRDENFFYQLIVWNPVDRAIVGGYRFLLCDHLPTDADGQVDTPTSELFYYSEKFVNDYLPYTIELGRSFVQPNYQPSKSLSKGLYSLDNLWDGLGSLVDIYPEARYYFGKVTMYPSLERTSRDLILYFIQKHFPDKDNLVMVRPELDLPILTDKEWLESIFNADNYRDNYKILVKQVRDRGAAVPPLVNAYMNLSPTLRSFGTALNPGFGEVEETGILMTISDMFEEKVKRHLIYDQNEIPEHLKMPFYAN